MAETKDIEVGFGGDRGPRIPGGTGGRRGDPDRRKLLLFLKSLRRDLADFGLTARWGDGGRPRLVQAALEDGVFDGLDKLIREVDRNWERDRYRFSLVGLTGPNLELKTRIVGERRQRARGLLTRDGRDFFHRLGRYFGYSAVLLESIKAALGEIPGFDLLLDLLKEALEMLEAQAQDRAES